MVEMNDDEKVGSDQERLGPEIAHLALWIERLPDADGSPMEVSIDDGRPPSMLTMVRACSAIARAVHTARSGTVGSALDHARVVAEAINKFMGTKGASHLQEHDRVPDFLVTQYEHGMQVAFSPFLAEKELTALMLQVFRTVYRAMHRASVVYDREEFATCVQRLGVHEDETEVG